MLSPELEAVSACLNERGAAAMATLKRRRQPEALGFKGVLGSRVQGLSVLR